jgi:hypothetical protein
MVGECSWAVMRRVSYVSNCTFGAVLIQFVLYAIDNNRAVVGVNHSARELFPVGTVYERCNPTDLAVGGSCVGSRLDGGVRGDCFERVGRWTGGR